jgi:hypothetical protein
MVVHDSTVTSGTEGHSLSNQLKTVVVEALPKCGLGKSIQHLYTSSSIDLRGHTLLAPHVRENRHSLTQDGRIIITQRTLIVSLSASTQTPVGTPWSRRLCDTYIHHQARKFRISR